MEMEVEYIQWECKKQMPGGRGVSKLTGIIGRN